VRTHLWLAALSLAVGEEFAYERCLADAVEVISEP